MGTPLRQDTADPGTPTITYLQEEVEASPSWVPCQVLKVITPSQTPRFPVGSLGFIIILSDEQGEFTDLRMTSPHSYMIQVFTPSLDILLKEGTQGSTMDPTSACRLSPNQQLTWKACVYRPLGNRLRVCDKRILGISCLTGIHNIHQGNTCVYIY